MGISLYRSLMSKSEVRVMETSKVRKGAIREVLVETGIIKPQVGAQVKIGARATGVITEMHVKVGDRVKRGDLIAKIDDRDIVQNINQIKASILATENTIEQINKTYPERIKEASSDYEYAKINHKRTVELLRQEFTTQDALDQARNRLEASEAVLKRLKKEFETQLKIENARLNELKAQLAQLEVKLSFTQIIAPIDGVVTEVTAQQGETIVTGLQVANLVTILDPSRLELWIYVDETDIGKVKPGQEVEFRVDTYPNRTFQGAINTIYPNPVVKDNITYYLASLLIPSDDAALLRPEMTTYSKIIMKKKENILLIPNAGLKFERDKQVAYKVTGKDQVEKLIINTGIRGEDETEVISGLNEGDEVATKIILSISNNKKASKGPS